MGSVNGIIRLMGSVCLGPKVIQLSGAYCSMIIVQLAPLNVITVNVIIRLTVSDFSDLQILIDVFYYITLN